MFGPGIARRELRRYLRKGPAGSTRRLIDALAAGGVEGRTFLDIGGGIGAIQCELMARGAKGGTGVDASPAYLQAARAEAVRRGYGDRIRHVGGDFTFLASDLEAADLVTLDRVLCCYPDMPALLAAAAPLSRTALGLVFPRSTWLTRTGVALVNAVQRLRRHPFRVHIHDPQRVEALLAHHGFGQRLLHEGRLWRVELYRRLDRSIRVRQQPVG